MAVNICFIHTCSRFLMVDFTTSASAQARVYNEDSRNLWFRLSSCSLQFTNTARCAFILLQDTVRPWLFELGFFESPCTSNSKPFALDLPFSHLLLAFQTPTVSNIFLFPLRIQNKQGPTVHSH